MNPNWQVVRAHALVILAVGIGIVGMGMVFNGAMDGSLRELSRGVPPLLVGLWWAGRQLGQSMTASRARRMIRASHVASSPVSQPTSTGGHERGHR